MLTKTIMGFELPCCICRTRYLVGPTKTFTEHGTNQEATAYWSPDPDDDGGVIGVSYGNGDTFACLPCHAEQWARRIKEMPR